MAPLNPISYADARRKLIAAGFAETSQAGSHVKFAKHTDNGVLTAIVPKHREIAVGTLRSILRQAQITTDDWESLS